MANRDSQRKRTPDILGEILSGDEQPSVENGSAAPAVQKASGSQGPEPTPKKSASLQTRRAGANPNTAQTASRPAAGVLQPKVAQQPSGSSPVIFETLVVSFQEYERTWRPRYLNGEEIPGWIHSLSFDEFIHQLNLEGWQIAAASAGEPLYGRSDTRQVFFQRTAR